MKVFEKILNIFINVAVDFLALYMGLLLVFYIVLPALPFLAIFVILGLPIFGVYTLRKYYDYRQIK